METLGAAGRSWKLVGRADEVMLRRVRAVVLLPLSLAAGYAAAGGGAGLVSAEPSSRAVYRTKIVVYYFHRRVRCQECLTIEDLSKKAVGERYPKLLASGRLEFRPVLLDDPDNWHYVDEFLLSSPSLVVAETGDGGTVRWKKLDGVWELVGSQRDFHSYIVDAIDEYLR